MVHRSGVLEPGCIKGRAELIILDQLHVIKYFYIKLSVLQYITVKVFKVAMVSLLMAVPCNMYFIAF